MAAGMISKLMLAFVVFGCLVHLTGENSGPKPPHIQCNPQPYAQEGKTWQCICIAPPSVHADEATLSWPGHSDNSTLIVMDVKRRQNGTRYTCRMDFAEDGKLKTVNASVTLEVAYGPVNGTVRIHGPNNFVTSGTSSLSIKCNASDTNPKPTIRWNGPCEDVHGETCTFKPHTPEDDGIIITCLALNPHVQSQSTWSTASYTLNLMYPPPDSPVINGHKEGQIHKSGDNLTCTVTGGKPLVVRVVFKCNNPTLNDQADVENETSVSSSLTISSSKQLYSPTFCRCTAIMKSDPNLYTKATAVSFAVIAQEKPGSGITAEEDSIRGDESDIWKNFAIAILVYAVALTVIIGLLIIKPRAFTRALVKRLSESDRLDTGSHTVPDIEAPRENGSAGETQPLLNDSDEQNPPPDSLNTTTAQNVDTVTAQNLHAHTAQNVDTVTAENLDTATVQNLSASTALSVVTTTAQNVDTVTAQNVDTVTAQNLDTTTSQNDYTVTAQNLVTTNAQSVDTVIAQNLDTTIAQNIDAATAQSVDTVYCESLDLQDLHNSINLCPEDNADLQTGLSDLPERDEIYHVSGENTSSGHLESEGNPGSKNLLQALCVGGPSSDQNTGRPAATPRGFVRDRSSPTTSLV